MSSDQWRQQLSQEQYYVCREKGTERPFTGKWLVCQESGSFQCVCCGNLLFDASSQFDSGCGWPSFDQVIDNSNVKIVRDTSHNMERMEVTCAQCEAHLGHVFNDGPTETGVRYCINSISIDHQT